MALLNFPADEGGCFAKATGSGAIAGETPFSCLLNYISPIISFENRKSNLEDPHTKAIPNDIESRELT